MRKDYLSYEEQFKRILNNEEINRIQDNELREFRNRYWNLQHQAFLDERRIPDSEIGNVYHELKEVEQKELDAYKKRQEE